MRVEPVQVPVDRSASWVTSSARLARRGGSATVISLDGLRKALGERWPKLRDTASVRLEQLLRQQLGPADCFVPLDDMNRLVIMPQAAPADGEVSCLRIAYDLNQTLAGSCRLDQLTVAPANAVGDNIIEIDAFGAGELAALASRAGLSLAPAEAEADRLCDALAPEVGDVRVVYQPVWDAELQVVRGYRCRPDDDFRLHAPENSQERIRVTGQVSLIVLRHAAAALQQHLRRGERFTLIVPVSFLVLSSPVARMQFLAACRGLDAMLRPYLAFAVKECPAGVPQSRIAEADTILQSFCGAVLARAPHPAGVSLPDFRTTGIKALGVSLKGLSPSACEIEIGALAAETRRSGVISFAEHVDDTAALHICLDRGVRWLWGAAVAPTVAEPGPLMRLSRAQVQKTPAAA